MSSYTVGKELCGLTAINFVLLPSKLDCIMGYGFFWRKKNRRNAPVYQPSAYNQSILLMSYSFDGHISHLDSLASGGNNGNLKCLPINYIFRTGRAVRSTCN